MLERISPPKLDTRYWEPGEAARFLWYHCSGCEATFGISPGSDPMEYFKLPHLLCSPGEVDIITGEKIA